MSDELLPCPFCGAQPVVRNPRWTNDSMYAYCVSCDARGPYGENKKTAIAAWNRRTPTMPADVRATMREALTYRKAQTEKFVATVGRYGLTSSEHANRIAAIDAALAWIDAQEATP